MQNWTFKSARRATRILLSQLFRCSSEKFKMVQYDTKTATDCQKNIYRNNYRDSSQRNFTGAKHLFWKWKGSCFKLIWHNFAAFAIIYALISIVYRCLLIPENGKWKQIFELWCIYCERFSALIPIAFLTGFYVSQVVNRWWDQFMTLPWTDRLALKLVNFCPGTDDFTKNLRRTVMRYVNLSTILAYRLVSQKVMDRFPDYDSLVQAKLMLPNEVKRLQKVDERTENSHESTWTPILWAMKLLTLARIDKKVTIEAPIFANLQSSFDGLEQANRKILNYGWVNFPLAYVQVATISVYLYFIAALFGRQYLIPNENQYLNMEMFPNAPLISFSNKEPFKVHTPDFVIPFFTLAEFFCYMGWIKVAETLLNPFGDDDEDFKINYLIDRNLQVSYLIVDEADREMEIVSDPFLDAGIDIPKELPYVKATPKVSRKPRKFSMRGISISSTMETIAPDFPSQCPSDNVSIAGSLASEVTRNAANTMSAIAKMNQLKKRLSRTSMKTDVEAASINVPSRTDDSGNKVYSESMPAMTTTNDTDTVKPPLKRLDTIDSNPSSPEDLGTTLGAVAATATVIKNWDTHPTSPNISNSPTLAINLDAPKITQVEEEVPKTPISPTTPKITINDNEICLMKHKEKPFVGDLHLPNNGVVLDPTEVEENQSSSYTNLAYTPSITDQEYNYK